MQTFGQTTNKKYPCIECVWYVLVFVCVFVVVCGFFLGIGASNLLCVLFLENFSTIGRNLVIHSAFFRARLALPHAISSFFVNHFALDNFKSMKSTANNDGKCQNVDHANRVVNDSP